MQTLAESATHLSEEVKTRHHDVDWRGLRGFRNLVVHGYLGALDLELTWGYLTTDVDRLEVMASVELGRPD
jgi:uncharacterized protein with HEPN domain